MMESMHTMSSTDMHIMRIPSEDDPMIIDAGNSDRPVKLFAPDQTISDQEKNMSDLVAEVEKSNSLIAYSSYNTEDQMQKMSTTSSGISSGVDPLQQDVYAQLAQKEKDLVLAAELGKALLGKNEDLVRQNEKLQDDFSQRLEQLEQEKHRLRCELEVMEEEYEQRITELQSDLSAMRERLQDAEMTSRYQDRERQSLVTQLSEQNGRLTTELQAASRREEELQTRLSELRSQVNDKRLSMQDHILYLENLKDEVAFVTKRKNELEKRVEELLSERESLNNTLDDTSDKIILLERHAREQDCQIMGSHREMCELRTNNAVLSDRLESLARSCSSSSPSSVQMSLLNEMEMSTSGSDSDRSLYNKRPCSQIDEEIEDLDEAGGAGDDSEITCINSLEIKQMKEEILSAQQQLRTLCGQLRQQDRRQRRNSSDSGHGGGPSSSGGCGDEGSSSEDDCTTVNSVHIGLLNDVVLELKGLLHGFLRRGTAFPLNSSSSSCQMLGDGSKSLIPNNSDDPHTSILHLEAELHKQSESCEKMSLSLKQGEVDMKRKDEEIIQQKNKLSLIELELQAVKEERDQLKQDIEDSDLNKDQLVRKAWEVRDEAVKRKNAAEIEVSKERIATMQINSQLLEAIQQKVELSKQLSQWQEDMEQLLEEQMKGRLRDVEKHSRNRRISSSSPNSGDESSSIVSGRASKLLSFFQRTTT